MKTVCQECNKILKEGPDEPVSHGLCLDCMPDFMRRGGVSEEEIEKAMKEIKEEEDAKDLFK